MYAGLQLPICRSDTFLLRALYNTNIVNAIKKFVSRESNFVAQIGHSVKRSAGPGAWPS